MAAQSTAYALRDWKDKQAFVKENEKKKWKKKKMKKKKIYKSVKSLGYMDYFFSRPLTSHYLKVASYI